MRKISVVISIALFAVSTPAQTVIGQLVREFKGKARGEITVRNTSLRPTLVTVEAVSFTVKDHKITYIPLDPNAHVKIGSAGAQLAPTQQYFFPFEATCDVLPCALQIMAKFSSARAPKSSIAVSVGLPTVLYICQDKSKDCRAEVLKAWGVK